MAQNPDASDAMLDCSDKATIERLYEKMARAVVAKAAAVVRRKDLAAEIAHDTFIKLWQSGGRFPSEKAVYVWLYKTCHRAAIDHLRSAAHRREDYGGDDDAVAELAGPAHYGDVLMTRQLIQKYTAMLKPLEAEAFFYAALDGMTQDEIAEVMSLSRRTVQRLLAKADERFKEVRREAQ